MDASPNRNLLESEVILLTSETIETPEDPVIEEPIGFNFTAFLMEYWKLLLAVLLLLLAIFLFIVFKPSRKKNESDSDEINFAEEDQDTSRHARIMKRSKKRAKRRAHIIKKKKAKREAKVLAEVSEDGVLVSESSGPVPVRKSAASSKEVAEETTEYTKVKRARGIWRQTLPSEDESKDNIPEEAAANEQDPKQTANTPKRRSFWSRLFRKASPIAETELVEETTELSEEQAAYNENYEGVAMSKGVAHMGAAPTRDASSTSSNDGAEQQGDVHVNEHKRERRGLFGFFRSRKSDSETLVNEEDLGVAVNEPLRGVHAPTRKGEEEKEKEEYEVDLVSNHRKNRKAKHARKGWFSWKKKDIPEIPETLEEETAEETVETAEDGDSLIPLETGEEVSAKTARKYIKTKKSWFWKRKKKEEIAETEAETDLMNVEEVTEAEKTPEVEEDIIDQKTARKYIKPEKKLFKKKMKPLIEQEIPERNEVTEAAPEQTPVTEPPAVEVLAEEAPKPEIKEETPAEAPKKAPLKGGSIKSGGFELSGLSVDYRPSFFNLGESKLKKVQVPKTEDIDLPLEETPSKQTFFPKKNQSTLRTNKYNSTKSQNISFSFGDKRKT